MRNFGPRILTLDSIRDGFTWLDIGQLTRRSPGTFEQSHASKGIDVGLTLSWVTFVCSSYTHDTDSLNAKTPQICNSSAVIVINLL